MPLKLIKKAKTPVFKSNDPDFNHRAAQKAYEAVMKMDEDEARVFTSMVVGDVLAEDIEKNQRTLQRHLDRVVEKRIERVKKALVTSSVSKGKADTDALAYAQALSLISKAGPTPYDYGYRFNENDFRRDPKTGQFQAKVKHSQRKPFKDRDARALGIDRGAKGSPQREKYEHLSSKAKAQYQDEYRQISNFLGAVYASTTDPGDSDVMMHVKNKETGERKIVRPNGMRFSIDDYNPEEEQVIGVAAKPRGLTVGGAAFGLTSALGAPIGQGAVGTINRADQQLPTFSRDWIKEGDRNSTNSRLYNRMEAGGTFLNQVAPFGSQAQVAGRFAQFVGQRGPEAEKVFGPPTRKAAYRYRGTEKTPDEDLVGQYERAVRLTGSREELSQEDRKKMRTQQNRAVTFATTKKREQLGNPSATLTQQERAEVLNSISNRFQEKRKAQTGPSPDQLQAGRDVVRTYLRGRLPTKDLYALHLDAGNTPPSEGVLLDSKGQIRAQAVGYGDDHYLPFNLKNVSALKGGEYIRTRSVGGPTSEDLYTGLVAGARRFQVESRSGTFILEFEDDLRGGRRHNDKARRMVRRYEQLLDSVQSEQVEKEPVQPEIRRMITQRIREEYPKATAQQRKTEFDRRIDEIKAFEGLTDIEEEYVEARVKAEMQKDPTQNENQVRQNLTNERLGEKQYKYKLNGHGYEAAMKALQEQFPYYIKTANFYPTRELERFEPARDRGYVEPGRNRPTEAKAGLHGTTTNPRQKFSASQADYQDVYARGARRERPAETAGVTTQAAKPGAADVKNGVRTAATVATSEARAARKFAEPAEEVRKVLKQRLEKSAMDRYPKVFSDTEALSLRTPEGARAFHDFFEENRQQIIDKKLLPTDLLIRYNQASGRIGRKPFDREMMFNPVEKPFDFPGEEAYESNAAPELVNREVEKRDRPGISRTEKSLAQMDDDELKEELAVVIDLRQSADAVKGMPLEEQKSSLREIGVDPNKAMPLLDRPDQVTEHIENIHRMRALNLNRPAQAEEGDIPVSGVAPETAVGPEDRVQRDNKMTLASRVNVLEEAASRLEQAGTRPAIEQANRFRITANNLKANYLRRSTVSDDEYQIAEETSESDYNRANEMLARGLRRELDQ